MFECYRCLVTGGAYNRWHCYDASTYARRKSACKKRQEAAASFSILLGSWSWDECHARLRPRLADPPPSVRAILCVPQHREPPTVGFSVGGGAGHVGGAMFGSRPIALPVYQPGALVKRFSSRIMTRSARLWPPLPSFPRFPRVPYPGAPSLSSYPCSFLFFPYL